MTHHLTPRGRRSPVSEGRRLGGRAGATGLLVVGLLVAAPLASAQAAAVPLGTDDSFAVVSGSTVTNTGPSVISGNLGVSPGTAATGFPPGTVTAGTIHGADSVATQAQADLVTAYNDAAGRSSTATISADLAGSTLTPGVYTSASSLGLSGALTLDAQGDPNAVFVFQAGSMLTVGSGSSVVLIRGAQACNVFWQVGSSASLGSNSSFAGNIMALTSISLTTGAKLNGRALARNGEVTLDTNTITKATCAASTPVNKTPPTATNTSATTKAGTSMIVQLRGKDATRASLRYKIVRGPSHGTLSAINLRGQVRYKPRAGYAGRDTFTYKVTSSNGTSKTVTVTVTVRPVTQRTAPQPARAPVGFTG